MGSSDGTDAQDGIYERDEANYYTRNREEDGCNPGLVCGVNASKIFINDEAQILINIF